VKIRFQCNLTDYREALHFHLKRSIGYYALLVLGSMSVLYGSFLAYKVDFRRGLMMQLLGIFWLAWPVVVRPLWVRRDFRKHPNFSASQVMVLSDEGIQSTSDTPEEDAKWSSFTKFHETRNLFMLHLGARTFRVIPKRELPGQQLDQLRELLRRHLPTK